MTSVLGQRSPTQRRVTNTDRFKPSELARAYIQTLLSATRKRKTSSTAQALPNTSDRTQCSCTIDDRYVKRASDSSAKKGKSLNTTHCMAQLRLCSCLLHCNDGIRVLVLMVLNLWSFFSQFEFCRHVVRVAKHFWPGHPFYIPP